MWPHGEGEQCIICAGDDAIRAGILPVRPPPGELIHVFERIERDGAIPDLRSYDRVTLLRECCEETLKIVELDKLHVRASDDR